MGYELISLLFPSSCRSCSVCISGKQVFCPACQATIKHVPSCSLQLTPKYSLTVHAIGSYTDPLRSLILRKKRFDRLAGRQLAGLMGQMLSVCPPKFDYLVPIPLHWTRYARRGFNQSYEMARVLSKKWNIPVLRLLKRGQRTKYQSSLSHELRQENVRNVFVVRRKYCDIYQSIVRNKTIVFVDDLCTTGATLKNAALVLLPGRPESFSAVVACRVV